MSNFFSALIYYLFVIPISHLPFGVLYAISDCFYVIIYYIVGYRRGVVRNNIKNSFPEASEETRKHIEKGFYHHFSDFLVESVKSISISDKAIRTRCALINPELVHQFYDEGKDVIVLCGHYNNWEFYAVGIAQQMKHQTIAAYSPLKNEFFNRKILQSRQRYGLKMISMRSFPRYMSEKEANSPTLSVLVNDQSPSNPKSAYWNTFFNQDTGWMDGAEKLAKKYNQVVLFGAIRKKNRGFYEVTFSEITENANKAPHGSVIDKHAAHLEKVIREAPQFWLWSHRRWKHSRPVEQNK